jgi:hypothetical protein
MISTAYVPMEEYRTNVVVVGETQPYEAAPPGAPAESTPPKLDVVFATDWTLEDAWRSYLSVFPDRQLARAASTFLERARTVGGALPVPTAIPSGDGSIHLAWDRNEHHLDADIFPDGSFDWFYRNRLTDELDGTADTRATGMSEALAGRLRLVAQ